jgi:hypothetical protein
VSDASNRPGPHTIHERFAAALLREALAPAGKLHVDYRVDTERETIRVWEPRRSANDPAPVPAPDPDPMKRLGQGILEAVGMRAQDVEIGGEPDWIHLYFEPEPRGKPAPGLLGAMTRGPAILSPSHMPAGAHEANDEMRKTLNLWAMLGRKAKKTGVPRRKMPDTWVISTEPSKALQEGLGLGPKGKWPKGMYFGPPAFGIHAVVLRELPVTRKTLLLRLLGTGQVLESALAEQAALPVDAPERRAAQAALLAVSPAEGKPIPIEDAVKDPILRACRQAYRRWARAAAGGEDPAGR